MLHELSRTLEQRSDMRLGTRAARWRTWWQGYEDGQRPVSGGGNGPTTQASLFGIRPLTDRVVFLIDHSTSMTGPMPARGDRTSTSNWTRYQEAVEQMLELLESMGDRTRFNVVIFDDRAQSWHSGLQAADAGNLRSVRRWLLRRPPGGGTFLRKGFEAAVGLKRVGEARLTELEADTLVILCDGQTSEGSDWVRPVLERFQIHARWLIHTIQLGTFGDDSLKELSRLTGGDHAQI